VERGLRVEPADASQVAELADVAARTFPLACPPAVGPDDVAAFIAENLSAERFAEYLADPDRTVLTAVEDGRILGYAMMIRGLPDDADVTAAVTARPTVELSKMYVLPDAHGGGVAAALMTEVLRHAQTLGAASVWLGVNQRNERAQRFYAKHGFVVAGTKRFRLGGHWEQDYVMVRSA
jgi:GNAT superfamily N-acetyltransferase